MNVTKTTSAPQIIEIFGVRVSRHLAAIAPPLFLVLAAFVVPEGKADEAALLAWAKQHLATYKLPRRIVFLPQLPRNRSGKLLRRELPLSLADIETHAG